MSVSRGGARTREQALTLVRSCCLGLPEVTERLSHAAPTFFVREKKSFATFNHNHHGDGRLALWCAAPPGVQAEMIETEPDRFFRPPYVGHRGWLGVLLNDIGGDELAAICLEAYRCVAPKTLLGLLDA